MTLLKPIRTLIIVAGMLIAFSSCDKFEYDPNQTEDYNSPELLNLKNISRLTAVGEDTLVRFAVISDSHSYYESLEDVVSDINKQEGIDFVIHDGDITDYGYLSEYEWGIQRMEDLNVPYFVVVGNHDLLANGDEVYENVFSEVNFSFVYNDVKFIFFDSNGREHGFNGTVPDLNWISREITTGTDFHSIVLVSHVLYTDEDYDPLLSQPYLNILDGNYPDKGILVSLTGHLHTGFDSLMTSSVPHLVPGSTAKRGYYVVTIDKGQLSYERRYAN